MKIIRGLKDIAPLHEETALAIGNFDGIHLGHQRILNFLCKRKKKKGFTPAVVIFSPHPRVILRNEVLPMIQTLDQRLEDIASFGIDTAVIIPFNKKFSQMSASDFVREILLKILHAREIIVGKNFFFGRAKEGNTDFLSSLGRQHGYQVFPIPPVKQNGIIVSSSLIRNLLQNGSVEKANILLGRPYRISGYIVKGKAKGRTLGFPTANIQPQNEICPPGVFLTESKIDGTIHVSLTNIGVNPTFRQTKKHIETYLIGVNKDLYGQTMEISLLKKLREEIQFGSPLELKKQIENDLQKAKLYFHIP